MKLNHDCVRDILLCLEENLIIDSEGNTHFIFLDDIIRFDSMKLYPAADIIYCSERLSEAELISISSDYASEGLVALVYNYITFEGHQYLDNIRDKRVWDKVKEKIASTSGSASLKVVVSLAEKAILHLVGL